MTRGRPPKPVELKRRLGNPGKRALPLPAGHVDPLAADGWGLSPGEALGRVMDEGVPWLAETDAPTVSLLGEALELHERARTSGSLRDLILVQRHVAALLSQLGFDPIARARLGLAEVRAESKLEDLRAKASGKKEKPRVEPGGST